MDNRNQHIEFFGGKFGPWIPIILLVIGMVTVVILNKTDFYVYNLLTLGAILIAFLLAKKKKSFGDVAIAGLQDSMLSILIIAFLLAGILSKLLRQSGLIEALVYLSSVFHLDPGFIPLASFIICALISTACGTSSGAIVAVLPVMLPISIDLGCDASLVCGAVISGALFGDNLAPISDTTIASALTQESKINDVVKSRLPYALIAGGISATLFIIFGMLTVDTGVTDIDADGSTVRALVLLIVPIVMIILMKRGWDLAGTLIICDTLAIAFNLALGLVSPAQMVNSEGPVVSGINGMMDMIIFCILFFIIIESMKESGALDSISNGLLKLCKGIRSVQFIIMIASVFGTIVTAGSSTGITFVGPMANKISKKFNIAGTRSANLLDATACATCGVVPFCTPYLLSLSIAPEFAGLPEDFTFLSVVKYAFHPIFLTLVFAASILFGKGKILENTEEI